MERCVAVTLSEAKGPSLGVADTLPRATLHALAELYREQHGHSAGEAALPEGVSLADGLPDEVRADRYPTGGVTGVSLGPIGHGECAGSVEFWSAETWRVNASLVANGRTRLPNGDSLSPEDRTEPLRRVCL
jgi:hypothetical protein